MSVTTLPRFISVSEASERIGVQKAALHEWIQNGKIGAALLSNGEVAVMESTLNDLPNYLDLEEAARRIGTTEGNLREWLSEEKNIGEIEAVRLTNGEIAISTNAVRELRPILGEKENLDVYQQFNHLANQPISVNEAARKYDITGATISRWAKRGFIKRLGEKGKKVLLDEQDVAYCMAVYKQGNGGRGRQTFHPNGVPLLTRIELPLASV